MSILRGGECGDLYARDARIAKKGTKCRALASESSMGRAAAGLELALALAVGCESHRQPVILTVCEVSRDYAAFRGKLISVRGVDYYGLRETCPEKCVGGPWPSFIDLVGTGHMEPGEPPIRFQTDDASWAALDRVERAVEREAKKGKRFEIWVTVSGQLRTRARHSHLGPCDRIGSDTYGYGHLGGYPAQLVIKNFSNIEVRENPNSAYDYSHIYRGAF